MEKYHLLFIPLIIGLILMGYSWYLSYPISIDSVNDSVFNHLSILYWVSLSIVLPSMFMIAVTFRSDYVKWVMAVSIVLTLYSSSYFYNLIPTVDSTYYRGLAEYFIKTKTLDPTQQLYFQWPAFFILADIATSVSGLGLLNFEFLMYAVLGFLLATTLYVYASKVYKKSGFLIVMGFFISLFLFLNFQDCPFTLALALLFIIFMLDSQQKSSSQILIILILFSSISLTHAFVPLYFVLYALIRSILSKSKQYFRLFLITLIIFLLTGFTIAHFSFAQNILLALTSRSEYSGIVALASRPVSLPINSITQPFSRSVTISIVLVCIIGFIIMFVKRKLSNLDKAILLTGIVFLGVGTVSNSLGSRAIAIAFVPISLGSICLFESKFRRYLMVFFLVLLSLFAFVPLNNLTIGDYLVGFHTAEEYKTANFMIEKYDWNSSSTIFSHATTNWYIFSNTNANAHFYSDTAIDFQYSDIQTFDCIIYSVSLAKYIQSSNVSADQASQFIIGNYSVVYNSGLSYVAIKPK